MRGIADESAGWASAHSVPYLLTLDGDTLVATPHPDLDKYRTGGLHRHLDGLAADMTWTPDDAGIYDRIRRPDRGLPGARQRRDDDRRRRRVHGRFPTPASIRIILDGPVLEVASAGGLFGSPISPQGTTLTLRGTDSETSAMPSPGSRLMPTASQLDRASSLVRKLYPGCLSGSTNP